MTTTRTGRAPNVPRSSSAKPVEDLANNIRDLRTVSPGTLRTGSADISTESNHVNSVQILGVGMRELLEAITGLEKLGMDRVVVNLPRVVVVGDQSAGKSSIIEAISQIRVPRSTGTCTRCPFHINLVRTSDEGPNTSWKCSIAIQHAFAYEGVKRQPSSSNKEAGPFAGWRQNQPPILSHFRDTTSPDEVEDILRRAQVAVLNPNVDPKSYAEGEYATTWITEFSPNPVVITIKGPSLPDLSLVDLPGIITQTENGRNNHLPRLIQNLAKHYVKPANTLVLLACSMEGDIANSNASSLVRSIKGAANRTVGILTKPDRIPQGDPLELWKSILAGEKYPVKHSYYVTKQPAQIDLETYPDHQKARHDEDVFFSKVEPWSTVFKEFADRMGTKCLQEALSTKLAQIITDDLPEIRFKVHERLRLVDNELTEIPDPPMSNAMQQIYHHISMFKLNVIAEVEGSSPRNQFRNMWKELKRTFADDLFSLRPKMRMSPQESQPRATFKVETPRTTRVIDKPTSDTIMISDDEAPTTTTTGSPSKKRRVEDLSTPVSTPQHRRPQVDTTFRKLSKVFLLEDVSQKVRDYSTSDLPNEVDPRVVDAMVLESLQHWERALAKFFKGLSNLLSQSLESVFQVSLKKFERTEFYNRAWKAVKETVDVHFKYQFGADMGACDRLLRLEKYRPSTDNAEAWEANRLKELDVLHEGRYKSRCFEYFNALEDTTGKEISRQDRDRRMVTERAKILDKLGQDSWDLVIHVMAKVRGYYNIASARFLDNVCMSIQGELFAVLKDALEEALFDELKPNDQDTCIRLLADDPDRERRRQDLKRQRTALLAAQECLDGLNQKYAGEDRSETVHGDDEEECEEEEEEGPQSPLAHRSTNHPYDEMEM